MAKISPPFGRLLEEMSDRTHAAPLLRALGVRPRMMRVPPAARDAFGLTDEDDVDDLFVAGERGGLVVLLIETRGRARRARLARTARRVRARNPARPYLFLFAEPEYARIAFASFGLEGELRMLRLRPNRPRRSDLETLEELAADGEGGVALALRHARALDRSRVTRQFFRDVRAHRNHIAAAWTGLPESCTAERDQLALLLLCRLIFLYFLQRQGHMAGDHHYLPQLVRDRRRGSQSDSLYRGVFGPLFFGALNTRRAARTRAARALGPLPYLNGGLFERNPLERRFPQLDLPDAVVVGLFDDLLERYRFTAHEPTDLPPDAGRSPEIDPEMLSRVFEELMAVERRGATGTYYTPASVVDRLVREALRTHLAARAVPSEAATALVERGDASGLTVDQRRRCSRALTDLRVLDPACGSGAFLLGALSRLARLRARLDGTSACTLRREIVGRTLYGVDVQDDAALLCALRLWLALTVTDGADAARGDSGDSGNASDHALAAAATGGGECDARPATSAPSPLPNLDRRIRQGDTLVDPLDLIISSRSITPWRTAHADADVRHALRALKPLASRYPSAEPDEKPALKRELARVERSLAEAWIAALERRLDARLSELRSAAGARDLFGERPASAHRADAALRRAEARREELDELSSTLADAGTLPFFSFGVHFADASASGFDLVLSNPPWIRAHRWPAAVGRLVRQRYSVCRAAGWSRGAELAGAPRGVAGQVDLSLLFLERSVRLLAPGGTLAMLLPAKFLRSLYGAGARRLLLGTAELTVLEDHSLDPRSIFDADAFPSAVIARKPGPEAEATTPDGPEPIHPDPTGETVRVTMTRKGSAPLRFAVSREEIPVATGDPASPWLVAPPGARAAFRQMQRAARPLGTADAVRVRRGIMTGANDVLVARRAEAKLGGLARIRAQGCSTLRRSAQASGRTERFEAVLESAALRPLVRGRDIDAWSYRTDSYVVWTYDDDTAEPTSAPRRAARYLSRHAAALRARSGWRADLPLGALFRLSADTLGAKVAWHDLSDTLKAVALPARIRGLDGRSVPLVPLNTVYFIPTATDERALVLAAFLNSLPVRTFARAVAPRAKDARFRFLAWTISLVPLPHDPAACAGSDRLLEISRRAHVNGGLADRDAAALNTIAARCYGLSPEHVHALERFDSWLRGKDST